MQIIAFCVWVYPDFCVYLICVNNGVTKMIMSMNRYIQLNTKRVMDSFTKNLKIK